MTRHSKNCTASAFYSYHEKKKDTEASGYGTERARFNKDSMQEFDCCNLSLQPCKDPVITPDGYLYEREAIIEYMVQQKRLIAKKLKEYERQKTKEEIERKERVKASEEAVINDFMKQEGSIVSMPLDSFKNNKKVKDSSPTPPPSSSTAATSAAASSAGVSSASSSAFSSSATVNDDPQPSTSGCLNNMSESNKDKLPAFWVPSLTPDDKGKLVKKPDTKVVCPMSKKSLKMKDLIPVKFQSVNDGDTKTHLLNKQLRYVCAVTGDALGNSVPCCVLRPSGSVVTLESVEKILKLDNPMRDPITSTVMKEKDIIYMQRGASGFAGSGLKLEAANARPVMTV